MSHAGWRVAHAEWRAGAPRREPPVTCNAAMTCNGFLFAGNAAVTCNAGGALTFQKVWKRPSPREYVAIRRLGRLILFRTKRVADEAINSTLDRGVIAPALGL